MDVATIKGVIDRLTARGLTETSPDPEDGRRLLVSLTRAGQQLAEKAAPNALAITRETLAPLDSKERETLVALLEQAALNSTGLGQYPLNSISRSSLTTTGSQNSDLLKRCGLDQVRRSSRSPTEFANGNMRFSPSARKRKSDRHRLCDNEGVPLICPTCQVSAQSVRYRRPPATLHGVVFDIFGWEPQRRGVSSRDTLPEGAHAGEAFAAA